MRGFGVTLLYLTQMRPVFPITLLWILDGLREGFRKDRNPVVGTAEAPQWK